MGFAVRTVPFAFGLGEIIGQFIKMRASTCPSAFLDTPHANSHLESLGQYNHIKGRKIR